MFNGEAVRNLSFPFLSSIVECTRRFRNGNRNGRGAFALCSFVVIVVVGAVASRSGGDRSGTTFGVHQIGAKIDVARRDVIAEKSDRRNVSTFGTIENEKRRRG